MHLLDFRSNLLLRSKSTWTYEIKLKIRRWFRFTTLSVHASSEIPQFRCTPSFDQIRCCVDCICPKLLGQSTVYLHAPGMLQYYFVHALCHSFWWGFFETVFTLRILRLAQNSSNLSSQYSPPLSNFKHLSFWPDSFSTWADHFLHIEHIRFVPQEIDPVLFTWIINKDYKIQWASERENWSLTPIHRYELAPTFLPSESFSPLRNWLSSASRRRSLHRSLIR